MITSCLMEAMGAWHAPSAEVFVGKLDPLLKPLRYGDHAIQKGHAVVLEVLAEVPVHGEQNG